MYANHILTSLAVHDNHYVNTFCASTLYFVYLRTDGPTKYTRIRKWVTVHKKSYIIINTSQSKLFLLYCVGMDNVGPQKVSPPHGLS